MTELVSKTAEAIDNHLIKLDLVVTEYLKGSTQSQIVKSTGLSSATVGSMLREWRDMASNSDLIKSRATMALNNADKHYDKLIKKAYGVLDDAEQANSLSQRAGTIKLIADMEARRIDLLQKAGALENTDMANKIMETERKQAIVMDILKNTVGSCDHCRPIVQEKLSQITNDIVVIPVD